MAAPDDPQCLGQWEKDRILGTGGFGIVTLWKHVRTQERIAIKKCRWGVDSIMTKTHKDRWAGEVDIMQRLSHPNVVRAIPVPDEFRGLVSELPLLCMEFCSGGDLRQILNKPENCCGLPEAEVRCLLHDIKAAIQYLHGQRITHRDLKPENIVLQEMPNCPMIYKLIDLGYAKELESSSICSSFVGTMQYLAPEFFIGSGYSTSVDYWSLGLVSHEAITGVRPFLPNASSPVDWMPKVEKKSTNDICVYEVPGTKEIKYSQQLFTENLISRCLREELEKWLRIALEWNPKKRGRSPADNKLTIFSLLDDILSKKIVIVFSVSAFACHSYQVDSATAVSTLQLWIERDTKQPMSDQLLLLPSGKQLSHNNMAIDCWNPNETSAMLYVFRRTSLSLPNAMDVKVADRVPSLVQWLMGKPRVELEYHHQKHVWRHAVFFLRQEYELYQLFLEAYAVKMLSLIEQSYMLTQLETEVTTDVERLTAMHKMSSDMLEFDNKCYGRHLSSIKPLVGLGKLMTNWATEVNSLAQKLASFQEALNSMKSRIQEAHGRLGSLQEYQAGWPGQEDLKEFARWMEEGYNCYDNIRKRKDRSSKHHSLDMARIVYKCFKQIDISLQNTNFDTHLKMLMNCEEEIVSLTKALAALRQQVVRGRQEVMRQQYLRQKDTWALVKRLANTPEQTAHNKSTLSLNSLAPLTPSPQTSLASPAIMSSSLIAPDFSIPAAPLPQSTLPQRKSQVPEFVTPSLSPSFNNEDVNNGPQQCSPSKPTSVPTPSNVSSTTVGFDVSSHQTPMNHSLSLPGSSKTSFNNIQPSLKSQLDAESLIMDNISIRYAMQDSLVSFTQCSNAISSKDFDWSYLDEVKK